MPKCKWCGLGADANIHDPNIRMGFTHGHEFEPSEVCHRKLEPDAATEAILSGPQLGDKEVCPAEKPSEEGPVNEAYVDGAYKNGFENGFREGLSASEAKWGKLITLAEHYLNHAEKEKCRVAMSSLNDLILEIKRLEASK
jgi:hypothetical protein